MREKKNKETCERLLDNAVKAKSSYAGLITEQHPRAAPRLVGSAIALARPSGDPLSIVLLAALRAAKMSLEFAYLLLARFQTAIAITVS